MTLYDRAVRMHLEIEIACEHFDRTLPGAMDGPTWRVHPNWRGESERYAKATTKLAREKASQHDDMWSPEDDEQARHHVGGMTLEAMKSSLESMQRLDRMRAAFEVDTPTTTTTIQSVDDAGMASMVISQRLDEPLTFFVFKGTKR